ncbi:MAG: glycosyltransferase family 2 protein [Anaerolineales bacterium]|jgi:glycosyltransferase involved in cell wall biosynthesis|nr:glycosyltransferase family 2 protein [Anaerolineales bacterium]
MSPLLTVFVPAYNEAANLESCVQALHDRLHALGIEAEILVVDDGSQDGSGALADALASRWSHVRVIHHPANRGIGAAFLTAVSAALGDWLILIPADLAMDLDDLPCYLEAAQQADIVVGLRSDRSDYTWIRRLISWVNIRLVQVLFGMELRQFQYISMYRTAALRQIKIEYWQSAFFLAEILIKARDQGFRLVEVEVRYLPRRAGRATGVRPRLVLRTVRDLLHYFWTRSRR